MRKKDLNKEVREAMREKGLTHYEVSNTLGISYWTFSVWLQSEFTPERKTLVLAAIRDCKGMKSKNYNTDIRNMIRERGLTNYEVANALGVNSGTFNHWLQKEFTQEQRERTLAAIESITD